MKFCSGWFSILILTCQSQKTKRGPLSEEKTVAVALTVMTALAPALVQVAGRVVGSVTELVEEAVLALGASWWHISV